MNEIILTSAGKMGDFLYCLPVAQWLARHRDCKIHWVLPGSFNPFNFITPLLMKQGFTSRVTIVPYQVANFDCGGQPYKFNPADYGVSGEYYNLGFRSYPDKYVAAYYAEEHGFDYDRQFRLDIGPPPTVSSGEVLRSTEGAMAKLVPFATPMGTHEDLLTLAMRMAAAKEVNTWFCGVAILAAMCSIPVKVHRVPGHAYIPLYYEPDQYQGPNAHVTFVEHEEYEIK